jgi:hypothetical protein
VKTYYSRWADRLATYKAAGLQSPDPVSSDRKEKNEMPVALITLEKIARMECARG